jgi:hypothetical protein
MGDHESIAESLEGLGELAAAQGESRRAARLWGAAEAQREVAGVPRSRMERAGHERTVAAARAALGEEAFAAAWEAGRALSPDAAVPFALDDSSASSAGHRPSPGEGEPRAPRVLFLDELAESRAMPSRPPAAASSRAHRQGAIGEHIRRREGE